MLMRTLLIAGLVTMVMAGSPARAVEEADAIMLREQVRSLRLDLAELHLRLSRTLDELREYRAFASGDDPEASIAAMRRQRQELAEERRRLAEQRQPIEQALRELEQQLSGAAPALEPEVLEAAPRWELDYQVAGVPLDPQVAPVYIDPFSGALLPQLPNIDRQRVLVRGTMQNRSASAWRYTFEIRLADRAGNIIGLWRYQTPLLQPGDLHPFEMVVPVTDVARIDRYQIGRIEADAPHGPIMAPQPEGESEPQPQR